MWFFYSWIRKLSNSNKIKNWAYPLKLLPQIKGSMIQKDLSPGIVARVLITPLAGWGQCREMWVNLCLRPAWSTWVLGQPRLCKETLSKQTNKQIKNNRFGKIRLIQRGKKFSYFLPLYLCLYIFILSDWALASSLDRLPLAFEKKKKKATPWTWTEV